MQEEQLKLKEIQVYLTGIYILYSVIILRISVMT
jgi:hypothetical protein